MNDNKVLDFIALSVLTLFFTIVISAPIAFDFGDVAGIATILIGGGLSIGFVSVPLIYTHFAKPNESIEIIANLINNKIKDYDEFPYDSNRTITPIYRKLIDSLIPFCIDGKITIRVCTDPDTHQVYQAVRCAQIKPTDAHIILPADMANKVAWLSAFIDSPEFKYWNKSEKARQSIKNVLTSCTDFLEQLKQDEAKKNAIIINNKLNRWTNQFDELDGEKHVVQKERANNQSNC